MYAIRSYYVWGFMKNIVKWFAAFALVSALVGCARTVPVDNIQTVVSAGHNAQEVV